jgi:hypothetical protein
MARVTYESKDHAGHKFWVARHGHYAIRVDANRPGVFKWLTAWRAAQSGTVSPPTVTRLPRQ